MDLVGFVIGAVALWVALTTRTRAARLEREVATLRKAVQIQQADSPTDPSADGTATLASATQDAPSAVAVPGLPKTTRPKRTTSAFARLGLWLRDNWVYPAAGVTLVLSGVFLVQYAVETGLLTPQARVVLALFLGALLGAAGEWLRRRPFAGDMLPATLSGAGLVIAMAAVLAALHLYAMIAPGTAFAALALLALGAIALGWIHGPILAALGIVAGAGVPFALGGGGTPPAVLFGYFALLALAGLGIDARRRWGWVSWLALVFPVTAMVIWRLAGADELAFSIALLIVAGAAMTLPFGYIMPVVDGPRALGRTRPVRGVRASFAASTVAALSLALLVPGMAGPVGIALLAVLIARWCLRAPALADQLVLPVLALPLWLVWQAIISGPVFNAFHAIQAPEADMPLHVSQILGLGVIAGWALIWRGEAQRPGRHAPFTLAGLALPGAAIVALETTWLPAGILGPYVWALHAMALAGLATVLALRYAAQDAGQGPRLGASAAVAFAFVALGLMMVLGQAALTIALAVLMVAAATLDRRFDIPALGVFQILASMALLWRLVLAPGIGWHLSEAAFAEMLASLVATLAGPALALMIHSGLRDVALRSHARLVVETGLVAGAAIAGAIFIARALPDSIGPHAQLGLHASVMIVLAWIQVKRAHLPVFPRLRRGIAWVTGALGGLTLCFSTLYPTSPIFGHWPFSGPVAGWPVFNDLILAYLLPAGLLIWLSVWRALKLTGWALAAVWCGSALRQLWQGEDLRIVRGIAQPELYAYTFAILAAGVVVLTGGLLKGRSDLRKIGLSLAGLAVAKAFLIDAAELDGLLRAGAFLGLGLTLAGLAWLNGWAVARERARAQ
ncbi:MAG: DUF2339 domain-containing protein [Rhodobacteraceae bacterium]|nr:DUF2339 domain-containing protein [Paracoccaceae bacterium]